MPYGIPIFGKELFAMTYTVIRSNRRSVSLEIKGGEVIVRAPMMMSDCDIEAFVVRHRSWLEERLSVSPALALPETVDIESLKERAYAELPLRARRFADMLGVSFGKITVRTQRTRWGSCSSRGNLSFNCLLMLAPDEVIDSVVAHEICHLKAMNHSKEFYSYLLAVCPSYYECREWLRKNGEAIMSLAK